MAVESNDMDVVKETTDVVDMDVEKDEKNTAEADEPLTQPDSSSMNASSENKTAAERTAVRRLDLQKSNMPWVEKYRPKRYGRF